MSEQWKDRFDKWRDRAAKRLPELSQRVFALRNKSYSGCGFQWSLEKSLGSAIYDIQNYDSYPKNSIIPIIIKVNFTYLHKRLVIIESQQEGQK